MAANGRGVINLRFNQDQGCFTCCMENGLRIYNVDPLVEKAHYDAELMGSLGHCEMLYRTNLFAVVAGGYGPKFANNTVLVFDDLQKKFIIELVFSSPVKAVRLRKDKIVVATSSQITVFSFPSPTKRLLSLETRHNELGLCEVSPVKTAERQLLVFPGHKMGSVQLLDLAGAESGMSSAPVTIRAHDSELACLSLNNQGTLIATASSKGTLVYVWDTSSLDKLVKFRRGLDHVTLYSISFSKDSEFLCCCSDKGTTHIFAIKKKDKNKRTTICGLQGEFKAFANFTVPPESGCICAFGSPNSVIAVCLDGTFHKYVFNTEGNCNRESYDVYLDVCDDDEY